MDACERCGATDRSVQHDCFGLKPMSIAPAVSIMAQHFERGPLEIKPDHDANWWLAYQQPGVKHWFVVDDEESSCIDDSEFDGWFAEMAE